MCVGVGGRGVGRERKGREGLFQTCRICCCFQPSIHLLLLLLLSHYTHTQPPKAIELLETALDLRRQLFSSSSFLYADTAALLAKTLMQQHAATAAAAAASEGAAAGNGSSGSSSWYSRVVGGSSSSGSSNKASPDVLRAIKLWQQAVQIVEDSGENIERDGGIGGEGTRNGGEEGVL